MRADPSTVHALRQRLGAMSADPNAVHALRQRLGAMGADPSTVHALRQRLGAKCAPTQDAASPGRDFSGDLHRIQQVLNWCFGLQSLCEVLSTVPAGANECRRCFRDFRKGIHHWHVGSTSDSNSTVSQSGEIQGRAGRSISRGSATPWDRRLRKPSQCFKIPESHICHHHTHFAASRSAFHGGCVEKKGTIN